jgi:hypothetical protein
LRKKNSTGIGSLATLNSSDIKLSSVKKDIFLKTWRSFCKRWKKTETQKKKKKNWNSHLFNPPRPIAHASKLKQATHTSDQPKRLSKKFSRPKKQKKQSCIKCHIKKIAGMQNNVKMMLIFIAAQIWNESSNKFEPGPAGPQTNSDRINVWSVVHELGFRWLDLIVQLFELIQKQMFCNNIVIWRLCSDCWMCCETERLFLTSLSTYKIVEHNENIYQYWRIQWQKTMYWEGI